MVRAGPTPTAMTWWPDTGCLRASTLPQPPTSNFILPPAVTVPEDVHTPNIPAGRSVVLGSIIGALQATRLIMTCAQAASRQASSLASQVATDWSSSSSYLVQCKPT
jgi:hypothetical protein